MEIGCLIREKYYSVVNYKFMSLLEYDESKYISHMIKNDTEDLFNIIDFTFDRQPVSSMKKNNNILYMRYPYSSDSNVDDTSIFKLRTDCLRCTVIY